MSEKAQYSRSRTDIQHDLVAEIGQIGENGSLVSRGSDIILHHVLLLGQVTVELEILHGG